MALAPPTVQCMPVRLQRVPMATLQPASTTVQKLDGEIPKLGIVVNDQDRHRH